MKEVILNLAIVYSFFMVIFFIVNLFKKINLEKKYCYAIYFGFAVALSIIAYFTLPGMDDDLFRHYEEIERMKNGGLEYLQDPNKAVYKSSFIINYFFYGVALIGNNHILPLALILVTYLIIFYVSINIAEEYELNQRILAFAILILFAILPLRIVISGLRNWVAFAIIYFAIYRDIIKNKKDWINIVLYTAPIFIHSASAIIVIIRILSIDKFRKFKIQYLLPFWSIFARAIAEIFQLVPVDLFNDIGRRLSGYIGGAIFDKRIFFIQIIFLIIIYYVNFTQSKNEELINDNMRKYINFMQCLILFAIGAIFVPEILRRLAYFLAYLVIPTLMLLFKMENKKCKKYIICILSVIIIGLFTHQVWDAILCWRFII